MIDVLKDPIEEVRSLAKKALPKTPSPPVLLRWIRDGSHGVKLPAVKIGRRWYSTAELFNQFVAEQTEAALANASKPSDGPRVPADCTYEELKARKLL